jgi:hypothetical protein
MENPISYDICDDTSDDVTNSLNGVKQRSDEIILQFDPMGGFIITESPTNQPNTEVYEPDFQEESDPEEDQEEAEPEQEEEPEPEQEEPEPDQEEAEPEQEEEAEPEQEEEPEPEQEEAEPEQEEPEIILQFHPTDGTMIVQETEEPECSGEPEESTPTVVFVVPYRNRQVHKDIFDTKMTNVILSDKPPEYYKICYIHQADNNNFNRGAMKNIGFLIVKKMYPNSYQNITLVFNDVDTTPNDNETIPNYETTPGVVKHFFGYKHALGGIVSIKAGDFEKINGFPNYWSWGFEDNMLNKRVLRAGYEIDRSVFYNVGDINNIQQLPTTNMRVVNSGEFDRYSRNIDEGIQSIHGINYSYDETTNLFNIYKFSTEYVINPKLNKDFDISKSNTPFHVGYSAKRNSRMNMIM